MRHERTRERIPVGSSTTSSRGLSRYGCSARRFVDVAEFEATTGINGSVFADMRERRHLGRSLRLFGEDLDKAASELLDAYPNRNRCTMSEQTKKLPSSRTTSNTPWQTDADDADTPRDAGRAWRTDTAIPEIGALPGDFIVLDPLEPEAPLSVVRRIDREDVPAYLLGPYLRVLS